MSEIRLPKLQSKAQIKDLIWRRDNLINNFSNVLFTETF
jgi:hypothetical protein